MSKINNNYLENVQPISTPVNSSMIKSLITEESLSLSISSLGKSEKNNKSIINKTDKQFLNNKKVEIQNSSFFNAKSLSSSENDISNILEISPKIEKKAVVENNNILNSFKKKNMQKNTEVVRINVESLEKEFKTLKKDKSKSLELSDDNLFDLTGDSSKSSDCFSKNKDISKNYFSQSLKKSIESINDKSNGSLKIESVDLTNSCDNSIAKNSSLNSSNNLSKSENYNSLSLKRKKKFKKNIKKETSTFKIERVFSKNLISEIESYFKEKSLYLKSIYLKRKSLIKKKEKQMKKILNKKYISM